MRLRMRIRMRIWTKTMTWTFLQQVAEVLKAKAVHVEIQVSLGDDRLTQELKSRHILFHESDDSIQLAQIKKVYKHSSSAFQKGFTVEVKFVYASGKQDFALDVLLYDVNLRQVKSWGLLLVEK